MASKLDLSKIENIFPNGKIDDKLDIKRLTGKAAKLRSEVIRRVSDVVSESIGVGKKVTDKQKSEYEKMGVYKRAAPDALIDMDDFNRKYLQDSQVKVSQSEYLKGQATAELKTETPTLKRDLARQKEGPLGPAGRTPEAPEFSAITMSTSTFVEQFEELNKMKSATGSTPIANQLILTDGFKPVRDQLLRNVKAKMENILLLDIQDLEKGAKDVLRFYPGQLKDADFLPENLLKNFSFAFNFKTDKIKDKSGKQIGETNRWRLQVKPTEALRQKIFKGGIDLTDKLRKLHQGKLAQTILDTTVATLQAQVKEKPRSSEDINAFLSLFVAFAKEFEKGGLTPYVIKQTVQAVLPNAQDLSGKAKFRQGKRGRGRNALRQQRFISGVQLAKLVQQRMGQTISKSGEPTPPNLTERTGRFRSSINILADYRNNIIAYKYNPLYKSLEKYGYLPEQQVAAATREVVQTLFGRRFNIVRG